MEPESVQEVQSRLMAAKERGDISTCPCCQQVVKQYKRKLNGPMAEILVRIYHYFQSKNHAEWLHVDNFLKQFEINCRYYSLLERWGLIEARPGERDDGSARTGYWKITPKGNEFVLGNITVPQYFLMYNGTNEGFGGNEIDIIDALRSGGFNYDELMANQ